MTFRIALFCFVGATFFTVAGLGSGYYGWWWLAGILIAAALVPVVRFGPRGVYDQFAAVALPLVVVGIWCTASEGIVFFPEKKTQMMHSAVGGSLFYLLIAALLVLLARALNLTDARSMPVPRRSPWAVVPLVLLGGLAYLVFYWVFGAIAFLSYTHRFYPHAAEQVAAMGSWFPLYQVGRGMLMMLAVLPLVYTLRMKRWQAALLVGILVWIVGGGATLLVPNALMAAPQRMAHILEIMTQNVSLGATAVFLLRRTTPAAASTPKAIPAGC